MVFEKAKKKYEKKAWIVYWCVRENWMKQNENTNWYEMQFGVFNKREKSQEVLVANETKRVELILSNGSQKCGLPLGLLDVSSGI